MLETQLESFKSHLPNAERKRMIVLEEIRKNGPMTCQEVAESLSWPINCVSGRISELSSRSLISTNESKINPNTGKKNAVWSKK